jgi:hypothetical protein
MTAPPTPLPLATPTAEAERAPTVCAMLLEGDGLRGEHTPTSGRLVTSNRQPRKATRKRSIAGRCLRTPDPQTRATGHDRRSTGQDRRIFVGTLFFAFSITRRTRPAFLHIGPAPNRGCVVGGSSYDTAL